MRKILKFAICVVAILPFVMLSSCVDKAYDLDDLNKEAVFSIPPVPMGSIEKFKVNLLDPGTIPPWVVIPPSGIEAEIETVYEQTVEGLFTKDIIDKFFNKNAAGDVRLESKVDVKVLNEHSNLTVDVIVEVLDEYQNIIEGVRIPQPDRLRYGINQDFNIVFPREQFVYMQQASDLRFVLVLKTERINWGNDDFVQIKDIILKSSGIHFKF